MCSVAHTSIHICQHFFGSMHLSSYLYFQTLHRRKDQKKVDKLTAQIPYHEGRGNKEEVEKIKDQVAHIWEKAKEAQFA